MRALHLLKGMGLLVGLAAAIPHPAPADEGLGLHPREPETSPAVNLGGRQVCNTPSNRACWSPGFSISTDYEAKTPNTGVTRRYILDITEHWNWLGPDGQRKEVAMLVNGGFPGPTLRANWGDWFEITVNNRLKTNGTSIHWHGVRMLNNCQNDGANGITECPIAPARSKTYRFRAQQYGTTWYHSHFSSQYGNGVVGHIVIDGPTSLPYDEDLGVFGISDWYYKGADHIQMDLVPGGAPPPSDNIFFNGRQVSPPGKPAGGSYSRTILKRNRRHRLRIVNTSIDNVFKVRLNGHKFTVVETDFVPVNAFTTDELLVSIGQRYDVMIDGSQAGGSFWFNATVTCGGRTNAPQAAAIFQYEGESPRALPTSPGAALDTRCEDIINFTPVVEKSVPQAAFAATENNSLVVNTATKPWGDVQRLYWVINNQDINITWGKPTLKYIAEGNTDYEARLNLFGVPQSDGWSFWVLENQTPVAHPIHLHGHDFYVLGRSAIGVATGTSFDAVRDTPSLRWTNPTRRDVTTLPAGGWLVIGFRTDNPGAWLMHCHIGFHVAQGFGVQFLEQPEKIPSTVNLRDMEPTCREWNDYYARSQFKQHDSGLRRRF